MKNVPPMFGGAVQECITCGIGMSVWSSREPSSIGEGMEIPFDKFALGEWVQLIHAIQCDELAAVIRRRKGR